MSWYYGRHLWGKAIDGVAQVRLAIVGVGLSCLSGLAIAPAVLAQIIIVPPPLPAPPVIVVPTEQRTVTVAVEALGTDWGALWIDGQQVMSFRNFDRQQAVVLKPGGYRVVVTGVTSMDVWDAGYLDVTGDTRVLRLSVRKGQRLLVRNQPQAWLPDQNLHWMSVWR